MFGNESLDDYFARAFVFPPRFTVSTWQCEYYYGISVTPRYRQHSKGGDYFATQSTACISVIRFEPLLLTQGIESAQRCYFMFDFSSFPRQSSKKLTSRSENSGGAILIPFFTPVPLLSCSMDAISPKSAFNNALAPIFILHPASPLGYQLLILLFCHFTSEFLHHLRVQEEDGNG